MSLKRILGTMLATRMAGRGRRRGALGSAAMLGGLRRRRRPALGGKLGLAALGYMAYRAYQDNQSKSSGSGGGSTGSGSSSRSSGGIAGMVQDVVNKVTGDSTSTGSAAGSADGSHQDMAEEARAAEDLSDQEALLLIRAMITAAYSDGSMSQDERHRIMSEIDQAGADAADRQILEREIANPKPLDDLLTEVNDEETAEEFYLASRAAIDGETAENQAYLEDLRRRLDLSAEQASELGDFAA